MKNREHEFCLRCGRKLKNPQARELGYGKICYRRMKMDCGKRLFNDGNLQSSKKEEELD